jgi:hypothetical protein
MWSPKARSMAHSAGLTDRFAPWAPMQLAARPSSARATLRPSP